MRTGYHEDGTPSRLPEWAERGGAAAFVGLLKILSLVLRLVGRPPSLL